MWAMHLAALRLILPYESDHCCIQAGNVYNVAVENITGKGLAEAIQKGLGSKIASVSMDENIEVRNVRAVLSGGSSAACCERRSDKACTSSCITGAQMQPALHSCSHRHINATHASRVACRPVSHSGWLLQAFGGYVGFMLASPVEGDSSKVPPQLIRCCCCRRLATSQLQTQHLLEG